MLDEQPHENPSDAKNVAVHEAGHAIAEYLLGREFADAAIVPDPKRRRLGHCVDQELAQPPPQWRDGIQINWCVRRKVEESIFVLLAGLVAEELLLGIHESPGARQDPMPLRFSL